MKKTVMYLIAAALVITTLAGCGTKTDNAQASMTNQSSVQNDSVQSDENNADQSSDSEKKTEQTASLTESTVTESIQEKSMPEESRPEESMTEESKATESTTGESSAAESSGAAEDGYFFDDEEIVEDYHTATVFTDDEDFNRLFAENRLNKEYNEEMKLPETVADMRVVTEDFCRRWQSEAENAYDKLYKALEDMPAEQEKLAQSQEQWRSELEETEQSFIMEASGNGTYGMLAADSAMMNYYKSRAAVLYHQIYLLNGSFEMT